MNKPLAVIIVSVLVLVALIVWAFNWPPPSSWTGPRWDFQASLAVSLAICISYLCAATLFIMGLGAYKSKLKIAYGLITTSFILNGLGTVQLPLLNAFGLEDTFWVQSGLIIMPFLLGGLVLYLGTRGFAKLINIKNLTTNVFLVFTLVAIGAALSTVLPHGQIDQDEIAFDVSNAILTWTGLFYFAAILILSKAVNRIGEHYKKATSWMLLGLFCSFTVLLFALIQYFMPEIFGWLGIVVDAISLTAGPVYIKAGYEFYKTKDY